MQEPSLPVPPASIARAIEIAADPNCRISELADVVRVSPVLSAQLLKSVNSPYYGLRRKIATVDRAVSFMGIRAVRNILLCFGLLDLSPKKSRYPLERLWEGSIRRGIAAVTLAKHKGSPSPDNILTLGLCQDLGLLVTLAKDDEISEKLIDAVDKPAHERLALEEMLGVSHVDIGVTLFEQWHFPSEIVDAVRFHHRPEEAPDNIKESAFISNTAEIIADLMSLKNKSDCLSAADLALERIGVGSGMLSEIIDEISKEVAKAAEMLNIKVGAQPSYQEIIKAAGAGLFALNLSYEALTQELKEALTQQEKMAKRLEELNVELERQAMTDKLTHLANRRAFDESIAKEMSRAARFHESCALLLMDVDHFKRFNDLHGHQVGDIVLEAVGRTLNRQVRACDLPARYGGEEFAVIMPHTKLEDARAAAERIRAAIENMAVESEGKQLKITISIGVTVIKNPQEKRSGVLAVRRADDALYEAKAAGRNCVRLLKPNAH